ncbi:heme NO-binding domain-containing protein [Mucilaginibacter sp. 10I4]|nr:heme NO-binding domain-containing protein [Mucilaginibacter sp. 10I4]
MYGLVNNAIESLVRTNFGDENWEKVLKISGIDIDFFLNSQSYDDAVTFALANAVSEVTRTPIGEVFRAFGEWWVLKTAQEKYGHLMEASGSSLREFLINLPDFHNRIFFIYPKLTPPEFKISDLQATSLNLHYYSKRQGLQEFVWGLITGLGKMYRVPVEIELVSTRSRGNDHEIFKINW